MVRQLLGRSGLAVTPIGFGAFKIGRNQRIKYADAYPLPDDETATRLIFDVLESGINYIDTAPAYGVSEARIGRALGDGHRDVVISTKAGEIFDHGESRHDFGAASLRQSVTESARRLRRDPIDLVFLHAPSDDGAVLDSTDAVETLLALKAEGTVRAIGFSGKTVAAARRALAWSDVLMIEYHEADRSHQEVIGEAARAGIGVVVKKGLASGRLDAASAADFVLGNPAVGSLVVGSLSIGHVREIVGVAGNVRP